MTSKPLPNWNSIVAMGQNRVIGVNNDLPWHLPEDLKFVKKKSLGGTVVMGRKTFESVNKPFPKRRNIVLSRSASEIEGVEIARSLDEVAAMTAGETVWIFGGAQIYTDSLPWCSTLFVTHVKRAPEGDAFFPAFEDQFAKVREISETEDFTIIEYRNRKA